MTVLRAVRVGAICAAFLALLGGPTAHARATRCASHAAKHDRIAAFLSQRGEVRLQRGDAPGAEAQRRSARWHRRLARYYRLQRRHARPRGAALTWRTLRRSVRLRRRFLTAFEQLTPENEMKLERLQPALGHFHFEEADRMVRFARRYCKRIRGHTLVYGRQLPRWVADGRLAPRRLGLELVRHVQTVVGRYSGRVAEWDVVNEAVDPAGHYLENAWYRKLGRTYVELAFRAAREADPHALLFYNDSGIELPDHPHTVAVRTMVAKLRRRGVPIDGVGIQNHVTTTRHASERQLARTIRGFTDLGVDVAITEMDVRLDSAGSPAQLLERQRLVYRSAARACRRNPRCTSFSTWGVSDGVSWLGPSAAGLLFDRGYRPKPAFGAVSRSLGSPLTP